MRRPRLSLSNTGRYIFLLIAFATMLLLLMARLIQLTVFERSFLQNQGNVRSHRVITLPAHRGMITDRYGIPLAVSTPVYAVWVNPQDILLDDTRLSDLATLLSISLPTLQARLVAQAKHHFVYLKRGVEPARAERIKHLNILGVNLQREFRRYYATGEVSAQLLGFSNVDDQGQEGVELAYNTWLNGTPGKQRVIKDRLGHVIEHVGLIQAPRAGHDLKLSIDQRIQYLAYRELKKAVQKYGAHAGEAIVLDAKTGEILAMVNQPSYNPNHHPHQPGEAYRNRAISDIFEAGSVMKTFSMTNAFLSHQYTPESIVDTHPGWLRVGRHEVKDEHDLGPLSVPEILQHSSNVGMTKITLSLPVGSLAKLLYRMGFGQHPGTGLPGENAGIFPHHHAWHAFARATLSFGYGISVTALQLARAYMVFAHQGQLLPVSLLCLDKAPEGRQIISPELAKTMLHLLQGVVEQHGTGRLARIKGYAVGGKTGTARMVGKHGYERHHHVGSFVGIAPIDDPKLVVLVVVSDPSKKLIMVETSQHLCLRASWQAR